MKPSELTSLTGAGTATGDLVVITDVSATEDKKQTIAELKKTLAVDSTSALAVASLATSGAISAGGSIKSTAGIGYGAGAGGTQTQGTSKATTVVLNKPCGEITLHNAALNAATIVSFTLTNSTIAAGDVLVLNHVSGGTLGAYVLNAACADGSAVIYVANRSAGSLSEAAVLRFAVIKGVTA